MKTGKLNLYLGPLVMIAAAIGGLALGRTMDPYFANGYAQIPLWRYLTKAGHTHGMPFGLINIVFGLVIARLTCSDRIKQFASAFTAFAILLPIGTCLRGLTQGAKVPEILAMLGGLCFLAACVLLIIGLAKSKAGTPAGA
jgi:hypothetical protein